MVEVDENLALGHLCNVVHGLAGVISHAGILISKASEDGRNDDAEIFSKLLSRDQLMSRQTTARRELLTGPRAMAAAARPIKPPFRA